MLPLGSGMLVPLNHSYSKAMFAGPRLAPVILKAPQAGSGAAVAHVFTMSYRTVLVPSQLICKSARRTERAMYSRPSRNITCSGRESPTKIRLLVVGETGVFSGFVVIWVGLNPWPTGEGSATWAKVEKLVRSGPNNGRSASAAWVPLAPEKQFVKSLINPLVPGQEKTIAWR